jgi:hypothetical protein
MTALNADELLTGWQVHSRRWQVQYHPGRLQPFTVWRRQTKNRRADRVWYFAATAEEAAAFVRRRAAARAARMA